MGPSESERWEKRSAREPKEAEVVERSLNTPQHRACEKTGIHVGEVDSLATITMPIDSKSPQQETPFNAPALWDYPR